jgi:NADH/F420H2 dehydrogenase subunit C
MTTLVSSLVAERLKELFPDAVAESDEARVIVKSEMVAEVAAFLKSAEGLEFDYLNAISGVDCGDYFEVVYHLTSLKHNHSLVLKTRCSGRENPTVPSVTPVWRGAELQEREMYDLMGIRFAGHPNLKRIFLWEGFPGHPLRKDWKDDLSPS